MRFKLNISFVYIIIWIVYSLQGAIPGFSGPIARVLLLVNLAVSMYYAFYANVKYKLPSYFVGLNFILIMFTIYGLLLLLDPRPLYAQGFTEIDKMSYLKSIYISLLPIYPFYVFSRKGLIKEQDVKRWLFVFIPFMIIVYFYRQQQAELAAMMRGSNREEFTNNAGYMFLAIIPTIALFKKHPFVQYALLALCMLFTFLSMKRGAILVGALCVLTFIYISTKKASKNRKGWILILSVALLFVCYYAVQHLLDTSEYFNYRVEETLEGNSSQRDIIYSELWELFTIEANASQVFLGSGACATLRYIGSYAHNDWLELLINQGLMGVVVYLFYWLSFYKTYKRSINNRAISLALLLLIVINFAKTLFSMSYNDMEFFAAMTLGYCLANIDVKE